MTAANETNMLPKAPTGIPGFDHISMGGLPQSRVTLLAGTAGSAKTVFATQYLAAGILKHDEAGIFVTFEESTTDLIANMAGFGWDLEEWRINGKLIFIDASPQSGPEAKLVGSFEFVSLITRIQHAVQKTNAKRLVLDSLNAIFSLFEEKEVVRQEIIRLVSALKVLGVTCILTSERTKEYGGVARYGLEEFIADNVIILRNVLEQEKRRRTIEILKFRGSQHQKGEWPLTVLPQKGIVILPLSAIELCQKSSKTRIDSGVVILDKMCGGGFFQDSVILVSGATGTGKTLMSTHFIAGGTKNDERCLLLGFEESREQLFRNAAGWGVKFEQMESCGTLRVSCAYPESSNLEHHLLRIQDEIEQFKPSRVALDSLSALERVSTPRSYREFVVGLTSFLKSKEIAGFLTATTDSLLGGTSITEGHISTITDSIILLRYVEMYGEMKRGITVLKMRGSKHDKNIREFSIDENGMRIGHVFRNTIGILQGNPSHTPGPGTDRLDTLFDDM